MTEALTYIVPGMHCAHCEHAVATEIAHVAGVGSVEVNLVAKLITVHGQGISDQAVRDAIDEAGYEAR